MMSKSELVELSQNDARSLDLLRQIMRSHFATVSQLLRNQRGEQAADLLTELGTIVQMILDRIADLHEIDCRRNVELIMLLEKVRHYEHDLFDAPSTSSPRHEPEPLSRV